MLKDFFRGVPRILLAIFKGRSLLWHVVFIGITAVLVLSGFDWWWFEHTRAQWLQTLALSAAIVGMFVPIITPVVLYVLGHLRGSAARKHIAVTLAEAGIVAWLVSSTYKAFTGRFEPELFTGSGVGDISRAFHFGLFEHGVFWGWPSSHTTVAFAMAVALMGLYPHNKWVRYLAPLYALYIGLCVSVSIHWFSDFVAGAILGTLVGLTAARLAARYKQE